MFITNKHLSRRSILQGFGASLALPLLDSMLPAQDVSGKASDLNPRFIAIEMVHGAAGSTALGREKNYWSPAQSGSGFEFTQTLRPLEPLRPYVTVVSNTDLQNAMSLVPDEDGPMADHARSSAVFLTAAHPKMAEGAEIRSGPSIDQVYAHKIGSKTRLPSIQLCIENATGLTESCGHGYSCAYAHTISWASATLPLPMEMAPRVVFERLFAGEDPGSRATRYRTGRSVVDGTGNHRQSLERPLGVTDRTRVNDYLDEVREVEQRIQRIEKVNTRAGSRAPDAPLSVPGSFDEHVKLMFDLQVLAFTADITRVSTFKLGIDRSARVYPESGVTTPFHALSHHGETPEKIEEFARLNRYHVGKVAYFLDRLRHIPDGDGNLLDHSVVAYGSPMGDSDVHAHRFLPLFLAGHANGQLKGNLHVQCAPGTPMANVWLTLARRLGVDLDRIGDSTGEVAL